ncbi:MAG: hypothetical protein NE328_09935 [Lentisphaeraceae bacterium]|nr:hypothetical protein [Lentisphaeraceae bacterium]
MLNLLKSLIPEKAKSNTKYQQLSSILLDNETYKTIDYCFINNTKACPKKKLALLIECLRREDGEFDDELRKYLFTINTDRELINESGLKL